MFICISSLSNGALSLLSYYQLLCAFSLLSNPNFGIFFYCSFCFTSFRINKALKAGAGTGPLGYMLSAGVLKDLSALTRQNLGHYKGALLILFLVYLPINFATVMRQYKHVNKLMYLLTCVLFGVYISYRN